MQSEPMTSETTSWFGTDTEHPGLRLPSEYALTASYSIEPGNSPTLTVVEAIIDITEPPDGQTSLNIYEHINPDALDDIITASATKKSDVEVRFTFEEYLVVVRSTNTILLYESLDAQQ